jgi:hypothetical protein
LHEFDVQPNKIRNFVNTSKVIMAKNTDKQIIDKLADDFRGYAALLRKIK